MNVFRSSMKITWRLKKKIAWLIAGSEPRGATNNSMRCNPSDESDFSNNFLMTKINSLLYLTSALWHNFKICSVICRTNTFQSNCFTRSEEFHLLLLFIVFNLWRSIETLRLKLLTLLRHHRRNQSILQLWILGIKSYCSARD